MKHTPFFLVAEDNPDDVFLLTRAFHKIGLDAFQFVRDGTEVLEYLQGVGAFGDRKLHPYPTFLLLDLKMPRMGGLEVLRWLKEHPERCVVPTVVCSSSGRPEDIASAYACGAHSYFRKRLETTEMARMVSRMAEYWGDAEMPIAVSVEEKVGALQMA